MYVEEHSSAAKRLTGVASEVDLREHVTHTPLPSVHPGFETQMRCHQKSKTGLSVPPQKGLMFSKNILKNYFYFKTCLLLSSVYFKKKLVTRIASKAVHIF